MRCVVLLASRSGFVLLLVVNCVGVFDFFRVFLWLEELSVKRAKARALSDCASNVCCRRCPTHKQKTHQTETHLCTGTSTANIHCYEHVMNNVIR